MGSIMKSSRVLRTVQLSAITALAFALLSLAAWLISIGFSTDPRYAGTAGQPIAFILGLIPGFIGIVSAAFVVFEILEGN